MLDLSRVDRPVGGGSNQANAVVTYSPAFTLVPTYECFNRCSYCNFRVDPGQDRWLTLVAAQARLENLRGQGVREILILSGEVHPASGRRSPLIQLIYDLCQLALDYGFIPHTNAGPLSRTEMELLRDVNGSMGLMLEQMRPDLPVHRHAPSKDPQVRLQQLVLAGELRIPFTTGLLLGIGETPQDWRDTLEAIAKIQHQYGHIQEVILQPHRPGQTQDYLGEAFLPEQLPAVIQLARDILPPEITIQIPPNLVADPQWLLGCLQAGARDLGGIVPKDEVNPDYSHLHLDQLQLLLADQGWQLQPRLAVYPAYDGWLAPQVKQVVERHRRALTETEALS
ncbi:7,8-didemethyl-8-hydroxy-5-deazariboflavin synthase subunit CofG [Synechococcus sp. BDU 130192]|uniref:7,8-didemethyl-8-hydroxy-5-deazariboflavin synthase subunit CofG n=1 Tax=Synechococcus sp. BDU 130192 TaxID=2042059 RepID=UPI000C0788B2|nr:7,8-didemethyl-8-hydroxy-5-deazariboflavin synthase subunit CofG [Synechococcus sp. BDU 130192]